MKNSIQQAPPLLGTPTPQYEVSKCKRTGALGAREIKYSESKEGQREDDCKKFSKGLTSQARTGQGKAKQNIDMI